MTAPTPTTCDPLHANIARVVVPRERIAERLGELARQIADDVGGEPLTLAALLTGSIIFLADLIRRLPLMMRIHLVAISSYPGQSVRSQGVRMLGPMPDRLDGQFVLIVDDILDSGRTLAAAAERMRRAGAGQVRTCVLLAKPESRRAPDGLARADYVGFDIADEFVVGYGLDHGDYYRNLSDVVVLKEHTHSSPHMGKRQVRGTK